MDDLDENPLYKAFLTKFRKEFEIACTLSYLIAIPHSECLEDVIVDQVLINSHILMPSKLLKLHYTPLQVGFTDDIELDGNQLIVCLDKKRTMRTVVNILAEERGYNVRNKEYRILLIDRPLIAVQNKSFIIGLFSPSSPKNSTNQRKKSKKPLKPIKDHDDCLKYLEYISNEITMELEVEVKRLQSNYLILSEYLSDAAERIMNLAQDYIPRYEVAIGLSANTVCDSIRQTIRLAVENHIVHLMHGKLMASILSKHQIDEGILSKKFNEIHRSKLTICQLGAQSTFSDFLITDEIDQELRILPTLQSPLAMVSSLIKLVRLISDGLNLSVKFKYLSGDCGSREEKVLICSDDLIATFVYVLAYTKPVNLFSISKYLETFGWTSIAKDQAAYYTATLQIGVQYVYNYTSDLNEEHVSADIADIHVPMNKASLNIITLELEDGKQASANDIIISYKPRAKNQFIDSLDSHGSSEVTELDSTSASVVADCKEESWGLLRV